MHICEFCNNQYTPRKQVKNPRACNKDECQKARQRDNENAWRKRHFDQYDKEYYEIQRDKRFREIQSVLESILDCLKAGIRLFGKQVDFDALKAILRPIFLQLGLRRINKFWNQKNNCKINELQNEISGNFCIQV